VAPFPLLLHTGRGYFVVDPKAGPRRRAVEAFRGWVRGEMAAMAELSAIGVNTR